MMTKRTYFIHVDNFFFEKKHNFQNQILLLLKKPISFYKSILPQNWTIEIYYTVQFFKNKTNKIHSNKFNCKTEEKRSFKGNIKLQHRKEKNDPINPIECVWFLVYLFFCVFSSKKLFFFVVIFFFVK